MSAPSAVLAPLRFPAFRYFVAGRVVMFLGNAMAPLALAFAVLDLTGSIRDLGLVVGARSLANVLFALVGGLVADRFPRQRVMVVCGLAAAATQTATAALVITGTATVLSLAWLSAVNGMVTAFIWPAAAALVPLTVPADLLQPANVLSRIGVNIAMIAGASLGGVLVATVDPGAGLAVDAAAFAIAAVMFALLRTVPAPASAPKGHPWQDLRQGWREFTAHTWLWGIVLAFTAFNCALAATTGVLGPAAAEQGFGRQVWGLVLAAQTAGMVLGGLLALRLRPRRLLRFGVLCIFGQIPLMVALAEAPSAAVLIPLAMLAGFAFEQFSVAWEITVQRHVRPDMLARVYSYDALGSFLAIPLGQMLAGPAALLWGVNTALLVTAGISFTAVVAILCIRAVHTLPAYPVASDPALSIDR